MLKVAILAEKYAVDYTWYVDVILNLIRISGDYVSEEVSRRWRSLIICIHLYSYNLYPQWWNLSIGLVLFLTKFLFSFFFVMDNWFTVYSQNYLSGHPKSTATLDQWPVLFPPDNFSYILILKWATLRVMRPVKYWPTMYLTLQRPLDHDSVMIFQYFINHHNNLWTS